MTPTDFTVVVKNIPKNLKGVNYIDELKNKIEK